MICILIVNVEEYICILHSGYHRLKNRILSAIFHWYIIYRAASKRNSTQIIKQEEYRQKNQQNRWHIGLEPINREWSDVRSSRRRISKNGWKCRPYFGRYFYRFFGIFPTSPARAQDTKSVQFFLKKQKQKHKMLFGNLIMICRQRLYFSAWLKNRGWFVKVKSNGTKAKRPLEQIQKTQGAKEKQFFGFSLGVLHGFSRKSNENEFSRKSNGGWIFGGCKKKKIITWLD